ncbi:MAG: hypothetical protein KYX65_07485 [Tabrizicola sp.]|jgi:hypothetical protein|nr:hypothetical protein [Tabrizicola sp.]
MSASISSWQCVLIAWGDRYPVAEINRLVRSVRARSRGLERTVLLSDRPREGLEPGVELREIPAWYLAPEFRGPGCQAKLCLFEPGLVPADMPAVYLDLDTIVFGDLSQLLQVMESPQTVAILQSAILPFGALARALYRITDRRRYARGNSSIVVYHPAHTGYISERFRELAAQHRTGGFKPLRADERFISWAAQPVMRAVPASLAVKFPTEYMQPWRWLVHLRADLPWIRRRREGLVAVTFPGVKLKAGELAALPEGATITDRKGRRLFWTDRALGSLRRKIIDLYGQPGS